VPAASVAWAAHSDALQRRVAELERRNHQLHHALEGFTAGGTAAALTFKALPPDLLDGTPSCVEALSSLEAAELPVFARVDFASLIATAEETAEERLRTLPPGIPRLSKDAAIAVAAYTIDSPDPNNPVQHEQEKFYVCLNASLRVLTLPLHAALCGFMGHLLRAMQALRVPQVPLICFRGLPAAAIAAGELDKFQKGHTAVWRPLTSTSRSERVAAQFAGQGGIVLTITLFDCADVDPYSYYFDPSDSEREVLLPPSTTLAVQSGITSAGPHSHTAQAGSRVIFLEQSKVFQY
jgi:hypothetical protein